MKQAYQSMTHSSKVLSVPHALQIKKLGWLWESVSDKPQQKSRENTLNIFILFSNWLNPLILPYGQLMSHTLII